MALEKNGAPTTKIQYYKKTIPTIPLTKSTSRDIQILSTVKIDSSQIDTTKQFQMSIKVTT